MKSHGIVLAAAICFAAAVSAIATASPVSAHLLEWDDIADWCDEEDHPREAILFRNWQGVAHGCGKWNIRFQCADGTSSMWWDGTYGRYLKIPAKVYRAQMNFRCWHLYSQPDYVLWICEDGTPGFRQSKIETDGEYPWVAMYAPADPDNPDEVHGWWVKAGLNFLTTNSYGRCRYSPDMELSDEFSYLPRHKKPFNVLIEPEGFEYFFSSRPTWERYLSAEWTLIDKLGSES